MGRARVARPPFLLLPGRSGTAGGVGVSRLPPMDYRDRRILITGVGNVFLGDDGFGVEVARRLMSRSYPREVRVCDFGIRGVELAYTLLDGYEALILVDATPDRKSTRLNSSHTVI